MQSLCNEDLLSDSGNEVSFLGELEDLTQHEFFAYSYNEDLLSGSGNAVSLLADLEDLMWRELFVYSYEPLSDRGVIRLLGLDPGNKSDPLRGSLIEGRVGTLPKYEALSYTWGSQDKPCYIDLVEGRIPRTISLHDALVRLRGKEKCRLLWADALCINQDDIPEKNQQIPLMPQIYSSAFRVVAYLGEEADGSNLAVKLLEKIAETHFSSLPDLAVPNGWLELSGLPGVKDPQWIALDAFWRRSWFRRIWVVQEIVLA